jgi:hypothetical protein
MALPTYDKSKRKAIFQQLPKGAYVIRFLGAKIQKWPSGDEYLSMAFDIAEGEYKGLYQAQFDSNSSPDKKWPFDAVFNLNVPHDGSQAWDWDNWNTFFADLEDSNNGFVFAGDPKAIKGKVIGAKFYIRQTEKDGTVYDHTVPKAGWTCPVETIRSGKYGKLPNDKLIGASARPTVGTPSGSNDFMSIPDGVEDELPF